MNDEVGRKYEAWSPCTRHLHALAEPPSIFLEFRVLLHIASVELDPILRDGIDGIDSEVARLRLVSGYQLWKSKQFGERVMGLLRLQQRLLE